MTLSASNTSKDVTSVTANPATPITEKPPEKQADWPGLWRMVLAMLMSGTIGLFVVESGQDNTTVVFWRKSSAAVRKPKISASQRTGRTIP